MTDAAQSLNLPEVQITALQPDHVLAGFSCGEQSIDAFVKRRLAKDHSERRLRVFCACRKGSTTVLGLYSLSLSIEDTKKLEQSEARHYFNQKSFPAVYIQTLAVMSRYQNSGLGTVLLLNALERAYNIAEHVSVFGVALRSLNDRTEQLYKRYGFRRCEDCEFPLMILPIWTLVEIFGSGG